MRYQVVSRRSPSRKFSLFLALSSFLDRSSSLTLYSGDTTLAVSFFTNTNYDRAYEVLRNWTTLAHTDPDFSSGTHFFRFLELSLSWLVTNHLGLSLYSGHD
jgi:hypothetical protein